MKGPEHKKRKHALLSASGASRWIVCTPSARLEEQMEEISPSATSVYAEEGTLAHEFAELLLRAERDLIPEKNLKKALDELRKNELYSPEMEDEVEKYIDYVMETFREVQMKTPDSVMLIESKLDFSNIIEDGFGTGDVCIIADDTLHIIDLKYGKGVKVEAEGNPQLMLYGIGAYNSFDVMFDIHMVQMTIVQPRLDHISTMKMSVEDLILWGDTIVKPAAAKAYRGEGIQVAGDHCRWCKVKAICPALAAENLELAKHEFKEPQLLTDEQLIEVYKMIPRLQDWANAVSEYILAEALKGKKWEGYKLVEGRSQRKWLDEEKAIETLKLSYDEKEFMTYSLKGIPAIEKLVGKKQFPQLFGDLVVIPEGKPTLVPESDKRPAMGIEQAKIDFEN